MKNETLIVGVGSSHGDDQFGWRVAEQLTEGVKSASVTIRRALSPSEILGWLEGPKQLIVCDACQNLGVPGRVHHWQWPDVALAGLMFSGSHDLGISAALDLADRLRLLPADVSIWSAEGMTCDFGQSMSQPMQAAAAEVVGYIHEELTRQRSTNISCPG